MNCNFTGEKKTMTDKAALCVMYQREIFNYIRLNLLLDKNT